MAYLDEHKAKFDNLKVSLEIQNRDQLKRQANGGNSIILVYPPSEESQYIKKAKEVFASKKMRFIDVAEVLVKYMDSIGMSKIERKYKLFSATPHKVFSSKKDSFLELIIQEIIEVDDDYIPVLIRTGILYGTGIENVNIMEHKEIMKMKQPLVLLYPGKIEDENLFFLNFKPASRYRCTVIE